MQSLTPPVDQIRNVSSQLQVALEAVKGLKTINEIASEHDLHPNLVSNWKTQLLEEGAAVFGSHTARQEREQAAKEAELYEQTGRLKMELEWLGKTAARFD